MFVQEHLSKHFLKDYAKKRKEKERGGERLSLGKTSRSLFLLSAFQKKVKRVLSIPL